MLLCNVRVYEIEQKDEGAIGHLGISHVHNVLVSFFAFVNLMTITVKDFGLSESITY